jgi:hypothetical protein
MKTEVVMKRELFGEEISQKSKSEFFSATDLVKSGNKWRRVNGLSDFNLSQYLNNKKTIEFSKEIAKKYGSSIIKSRGAGVHTWVHPLLFIDIALALNPKLKIEVYEWLFDNLIKFRNTSGDSYREMSAALYGRTTNKRDFPLFIRDTANRIKDTLKVLDWQTATEKQLEQRDSIHKNIVLLSRVLLDPDVIIRLAIEEYRISLKKT